MSHQINVIRNKCPEYTDACRPMSRPYSIPLARRNSVSQNFSWEFFSPSPFPIMFYTCVSNNQSPQASGMRELFVWARCIWSRAQWHLYCETESILALLRHVRQCRWTCTNTSSLYRLHYECLMDVSFVIYGIFKTA